MKTAIRTMTTAAALGLILALSAPAFAQAQDPEGYGDGYQSGAFGRVRSADEGATIVRAGGEREESDGVSVNSPLFPGDILRTDEDQRVEVQLGGGSTVRVDRGGELVFQSLPSAAARYQDNTVLQLNSGAVRISSLAGEGDKDEFRIDTPDASIYLLGEGEFRIETDERGGTSVASLRGVAEVVGNESSVLVRGGMRTTVGSGSAPDAPRAYTAFASDGFDRWCDSRGDTYRDRDEDVAESDDREDIPDEVEPYYSELSENGEFAEDAEFGTVWYPRGVGSSWRPYTDGFWDYGPSGYFWVSSEPWGWAPYHYGNWQWTLRGWCWVPGRVFAGAWVSWSWGSSYVGWAPLDYWGRPGWLGGSLYAGYYDPGCWTFVNYNHFGNHHIRRYAVPIGTVRDDLRHATVVSRAPSVDPRRIARSPEWRDRALRQVANDHVARMRPIDGERRPQQRLADVQNHLMRRPQLGSGPGRKIQSRDRDAFNAPSTDRRVIAPRARRILEDPRSGGRPEARPDTRNDVRDLYKRMSRPKETRPQFDRTPRRETPDGRTQQMRPAPGPRVEPRRELRAQPRSEPRTDMRRELPRRQPMPRMESPRPQQRELRTAPRTDLRRELPRRQPMPRMESPRPQRQQAPRVVAPRPAPQRQQAPRAEGRREAPRQQRPQKERPKNDRH